MTNNKTTRNEGKPEQPLDVLASMVNENILIRLMDRTEVVGELLEYDSYMNLRIALKREDLLIRGNNVVLIALNWEDAPGK